MSVETYPEITNASDPNAADLRPAKLRFDAMARRQQLDAEHAYVDEGYSGGSLLRPAPERFFRQGRAGAWRSALSAAQAARVRAQHGPTMAWLGYRDA